MDISSNNRPSYTWLWLLPAAIFLLGLALRLNCLDCLNLWYDEIASVETAQRGINAFFTDRFGWMHVQSPLHYLLVWLSVQAADPTSTAIFVRLPSALAGALTPLAVYGLGQETFGRFQALLASFFAALSIVMLDLSQDVRPYSMLAFLTVASVYCLLVAERTGSAKWWLAFALVSAANVLHAYFALTLVMPALGPYLLWVLWRLWSHRVEERKPFYYAAASFAAVVLVSVLMLVDLTQVPRIAPDVSRVSPASIANVSIEVLVWFTRFGMNNGVETVLQLASLVLALVGVYTGVKAGHGRGVLLCVLFCVVPSFMLAVLSTTNSVFPRYVLFVGPFYFLLVSNGLAFLVSARIRPSLARVMRTTGIAVATLVTLAFMTGAYNYANPASHASLTYKPDFRSVAQYLTQRATARDLILFADDPSLGYTVTSFYWHGRPSAPAFDARDPRLFAHKQSGGIYWVMSSLNTELASRISDRDQGWSDVSRFNDVVVLHEAHPAASVLDSIASMVAKLEAIRPDYQPVLTLQGCVAQARGDYSGAADLYRKAGSYFLSDNEYLQTAQGFANRGDMDKAWREASIAKFMRPGNPETQAWLARQLQQAGYTHESLIETQVAEALQAAARKP